jgi:hypothetical protein
VQESRRGLLDVRLLDRLDDGARVAEIDRILPGAPRSDQMKSAV